MIKDSENGILKMLESPMEMAQRIMVILDGQTPYGAITALKLAEEMLEFRRLTDNERDFTARREEMNRRHQEGREQFQRNYNSPLLSSCLTNFGVEKNPLIHSRNLLVPGGNGVTLIKLQKMAQPREKAPSCMKEASVCESQLTVAREYIANPTHNIRQNGTFVYIRSSAGLALLPSASSAR